MKYLIIAILLIGFEWTQAVANTNIDSLLRELPTATGKEELEILAEVIRYYGQRAEKMPSNFQIELLEKATAQRDTFHILHGLNALAAGAAMNLDFQKADSLMQLAVILSDHWSSDRWSAYLLRNHGFNLFKSGKYKEGYAKLFAAMHQIRKCRDCPPLHRLMILIDISLRMIHLSEDPVADLSYTREALSLSKELNGNNFAAMALGHLCTAFTLGERPDSATYYCQLAYEKYTELSYTGLSMFPKMEMAVISQQQGKFENAIQILDEVLDISEEYNWKNILLRAKTLKAKSLMALNQNEKARIALTGINVEGYEQDLFMMFRLEDYYKTLAELEKENAPAKAVEYQQKALAVREKLIRENYNFGLANLEVENDLAAQEVRTERLQLEKENQEKEARRLKHGLIAAGIVLLLLLLAASYIYSTARKNKRLATALGRSNQQLLSANQDLEFFSYSLVHDIQSYISQALNYSWFLSQPAGELSLEKEREFMSKERKTVLMLRDFCQELIAFAKLGRTKQSPYEVDLETVVEEAIQPLKQNIESTGTKLNLPDNLPTVFAHHAPMVQLFQNLIGNAVKYRKPGIPLHIDLAWEEKGEDFVFSIKDNGLGIPESHHPELFDLFAKGDGGDSGIGLALCKRIVELYDGKIWVESEHGQGSTFFFSLPN